MTLALPKWIKRLEFRRCLGTVLDMGEKGVRQGAKSAWRSAKSAFLIILLGLGFANLLFAQATPVPSQGLYGSTQNVTFILPPQSVLHYTTNGSTPTTASPVYSTPLPISATTTVKWLNVRTGYANASGSAIYTIDTNASYVSKSGLGLWFRADTGVTHTTTVSAWADQSGNGNDVSQATSAARPSFQTSVINGQPTVRFNGSQALTGSNAKFKPDAITVITVYRPTTVTQPWSVIVGQPFEDSGWNSPFMSWDMRTGVSSLSPLSIIDAGEIDVPGGTFLNSGATTAVNAATLSEMTFEGTNGKFYVNGTLTATNSYTTWDPTQTMLIPKTLPSWPLGYDNATAFYIGNDPDGEGFIGDIAEILVYDHVLRDGERNNIETYLHGRYNIGPLYAPSLSPSVGQGTYSSAQSVSFTVPAGATLYYTTNGITPTTGSAVYSGPISIASTTILNWMTAVSGATSVYGSATYTIDGNSAAVTRDGLGLWYRADVGVTLSGSNVMGWADQSGNGNDTIQGSSVAVPTYIASSINGKPVVHFVVNQALVGPNANFKPTNVTVIAVYRPTTATQYWGAIIGQHYWTHGSDAGFGGWISPYMVWDLRTSNDTALSPTSILSPASAPGTTVSSGTATTLNTPTLSEMSFDGTAAKLYVNGALKTTTPISGPLIYSTASTFIVGSDIVTQKIIGDIAEILVYGRALTDMERQNVEAYLNGKYGLSPSVAPSVTPSVPQGIYSSAQSVSFTVPAGATLYYTTDGSTPTTGSAVYSGPISIDSTIALKWMTTYGSAVHAFGSATYTVDTDSAFVTRSGLGLWFRADAGITRSGSTVSLWADQSGHGNDVSQATSAARPSAQAGVINGKPTVRFTGATQVLTGSNANFKPNAVTAIAVYRPTTATQTWGTLVGQPYASSGWQPPFMTWDLRSSDSASLSPISILAIGSSGAALNGGVLTTVNVPTLIEMTYDGLNGKFYVGGTLASSFYTTWNGNAAPTGPWPLEYADNPSLYIGNDFNAGAFVGDIAEILVYDRALSDGERNNIETYLYGRYAVGMTWAPSLSPDVGQGTYGIAQAVSFTIPVGATLYYTTDGSTPTTGSTSYTNSISIATTTTLKWMTVSGSASPSYGSATYTIDGSTATIPRSGLGIWLRADAGVTHTGTIVAGWADQSGNGNDVSQGFAAAVPSYQTNVINGKPTVRFNGVGQALIGPNAKFKPTTATVITVYRPTAAQTWGTIIGQPYWTSGWVAPYNSWDIRTSSDTSLSPVSVLAVSSNYSPFSSGVVTTANAATLAEMTYDGATAKFYVNGASPAVSAMSGPLVYATNSTFFVGSDPIEEGIIGDIAEILVYNHALTDTERRSVESYIYTKYHVGLP